MGRSKKTDQKTDQKTDTSTVAVARPPGPLAVWRLPMSVGVAAALTGMPLMDALTTGQHLDLALGRSFGAAFLVWIATGRINHILADAESRRERDDDPAPAEASHNAHL